VEAGSDEIRRSVSMAMRYLTRANTRPADQDEISKRDGWKAAPDAGFQAIAR